MRLGRLVEEPGQSLRRSPPRSDAQEVLRDVGSFTSAFFLPSPSPWKHSSSPIFLGLGQTQPSPGVPTRPLPAAGGAPAPALTCAGASQLLPVLCALEIRAPGLHRALHRPHTALRKGTDTTPRSHSHVRPAAPCRCPLPATASTGQRPGPRCGARLPVTPARAAGRPCTCCSFRPAAPPPPPGRLRLCHPNTLAGSPAGLRRPSRRRPRDAGSAPNGEGARTQASRGRPPGAGTGSGSAGPRRAALGPGRSRAPAGPPASSGARWPAGAREPRTGLL